MSNSVSPIQSRGPLIIAGLVVLLLILHQDNWFWTNGTLLFGFLPIGLFWHACISIAASATWYLATKIAWPAQDAEVGQSAEAGSPAQNSPAQNSPAQSSHPQGDSAEGQP